jgi:hypothetical protein
MGDRPGGRYVKAFPNHSHASEIAWKKEKVSHDPCSRIGQAGSLKPDQRNQKQGYACPGQHFKSAGSHGNPGISHTLNCQTDDIHKKKGNIKGSVYPDKTGSHGHDFRLPARVNKKAKQLPVRQQSDEKRQYTVNCAYNGAGLHPVRYPVNFSCSQILA